MVGEILLDSMPVKKRRSSLSGKPVLILVSLQTESYEEEYVGITLTHSAKIKIFSENSVSFEGTTASQIRGSAVTGRALRRARWSGPLRTRPLPFAVWWYSRLREPARALGISPAFGNAIFRLFFPVTRAGSTPDLDFHAIFAGPACYGTATGVFLAIFAEVAGPKGQQLLCFEPFSGWLLSLTACGVRGNRGTR